MTQPELPKKKDVMLALLERSSVYIHLDPRDDEVRVPPWFKKQPQLVLQVGLNMAVRIPDLDIGDDAVSCTLSFNRSPVFCYLPWRAIYALVGEDHKGMVWPDSVPPEVAAQQSEQARREQIKLAPKEARPEEAQKAALTKKKPAEKGKKPKKGPVEVLAEPTAKKEETAPPRESKRALPPYLRVVK